MHSAIARRITAAVFAALLGLGIAAGAAAHAAASSGHHAHHVLAGDDSHYHNGPGN